MTCPMQRSLYCLQDVLHNQIGWMVGVVLPGRPPEDASSDQD